MKTENTECKIAAKHVHSILRIAFAFSSYCGIKASTEKQRRAVCAAWSGHTSDDCIGGCNSWDNAFNHT